MIQEEKRMGDGKIKIWSEVTGFMPAVIPIKNVSNIKRNTILIQSSDIVYFDSTGLSILICKI